MFALLLITFVNFVGIGALIPILPYTVIENLGYSETVMTALLASFALAMFIANPILGRLSDKVGRQPVFLISLIIGTAAHLWFALSNDILSIFAARIYRQGISGLFKRLLRIILNQRPAHASWAFWARRLAPALF